MRLELIEVWYRMPLFFSPGSLRYTSAFWKSNMHVPSTSLDQGCWLLVL